MDGVDARYLGLTANQLAKIATDLEAENAKFIVKLNAEHIVRQNVEVENAKLRELVVTLWAYIQRPTTKQWTLKERMAILDDAFDCMRELGIEVPK